MRNTIIVLILIVTSCLTTKAQQDSIKPVFRNTRPGIMAGVSFNRMEAIDPRFDKFTFNPIQTYSGGIFIDRVLDGDYVVLHLEASYMQSSYSLTTYQPDYNNSNESDILLNLKTLNIPALIRINGYPSRAGLFLEAGIVYSYNFGNSWDIYNTSNYQGTIQMTIDHDDDLNATHLMGLCLGVGVSYKISGRQRLYANVRISKLVPQEGTGEFRYYHPQLMIAINI